MILGIDTSSSLLALGLYHEEKGLLADVSYKLTKKHGRYANEIIQRFFEYLDLKPKELKGIAVGLGPGSFTGMRVGITIAKVLAATFNLPLWGVSSLANLAANICSESSEPVLSLFDARNARVYWGLYTYGVPDLILLRGEAVNEIRELEQELRDIPELTVLGDLPAHYYQLLQETLSAKIHPVSPPLNQIKGGTLAYRGYLYFKKDPQGMASQKILPRYMKSISVPGDMNSNI